MPTTTLPAPEGTIYVVVGGVFKSPGRVDVPLTGDSPGVEPFIVGRDTVGTGKVLRI